jgi:YggT family protein
MQNAGLQALGFLITAVFDVMIFFVILRLLLQFSQVHYYNPIVQLIVRFTEPTLKTLRRFLPTWQSRRWESGIFIVLMGLMLSKLLCLSLLWMPNVFGHPELILSSMVYSILQLGLNIYFWGIILNIILSWVFVLNRSPSAHRILPLYECVDQLVAPILNPARMLLDRLFSAGRFGVDFSPVVAMILIQATQILISGIPHLPY